ncbi:HAMP domain-containing sensor histidine kinase [Paenibacillus sp. FJAT-26967]|uniref:sensor histidine kinase n=1 Tax=Paenibacillus sp. FJAT-26967 TaxID=1729690 RepID=UPI00083807AD|nr:sensor histidine kinase [Paenibacillus sp. FJAT-26967]
MNDHAWTWRSFLLDRLLYIGAFLLSTALMLLVIWLDLLESGLRIKSSSLFYLLLLAAGVLTGTLAYDYIRQRQYAEALNRRLAEGASGIDHSSAIHTGVTREQQAVSEVLRLQQRDYMNTLASYKAAQEQHLHFTNQWVHQLKTPVSVIDLLAQQSAGKSDPDSIPELLDAIASIQEENEKIAYGLQMMLYTARLEKFELDLHPRRVDLTTVVRRVINEHKKACIRASIFPKIEADSESVEVETDEKWLAFVLHQVVSNAIKYSRKQPGAKPLTIRIEQLAHGAALSIQDKGVGIAEEDLPRVFDAFFTGENGRGVVTESTGMGLYLARQVVSKLGHRIRIESVPGEGTTVHLMFQSEGIHQFTDTR